MGRIVLAVYVVCIAFAYSAGALTVPILVALTAALALAFGCWVISLRHPTRLLQAREDALWRQLTAQEEP